MKRKLAAALVALLVGATGAGCGDSSGSKDGAASVKVAVFTGTLSDSMSRFPIAAGFLEKEGVTGKTVNFAGGPDMMAAVISGSTQFAEGPLPLVWSSIKSGECLKVLGASERSMYNLIARPDVDLPHLDEGYPASVRDLKGKKIGVIAVGASVQQWISLILKDAGLDPEKDVTFIGTGGAPTSIAAFQNKQVDAMVSFPPMEENLGEDNYEVVTNLLEGKPDTLDGLVQSAPVTSCDYAKKHPEVVQKYCRAYHAAYEHAMDPAHKEQMGDFIANVLQVTGPVGAAVWDKYGATFASPDMTKELWESQSKYMSPALDGFVPDYDKYVDNECA